MTLPPSQPGPDPHNAVPAGAPSEPDDFNFDFLRPGRSFCYDRDGQPISLARWAELIEQKVIDDYGRVGDDDVDGVRVSTVWMGTDMSFGSGAPLIFETMIFGGDHDHATARYPTEADARLGHQMAVDDLRAGREPWQLSIDVAQPLCEICGGDWHGLAASTSGCPGEFATDVEIKEWRRHHREASS